MKKIQYILLYAMAVMLFAACGDDDKGQAYGYDPTRFTGEAPQVVSTFPAADATDVDTVKQIVITYDKNIFVPPHATIRINGSFIDDEGVRAEGNQLIIPYELKGNTTYTVEVMKPTVRDDLYDFASDYKFSFSTMLVNGFDPTLFNIAEALGTTVDEILHHYWREFLEDDDFDDNPKCEYVHDSHTLLTFYDLVDCVIEARKHCNEFSLSVYIIKEHMIEKLYDLGCFRAAFFLFRRYCRQ